MKRVCGRRVAQRGVTLIELMIAISLVAVISTGLLYATRSSLLTQDKIENRLRWNRERVHLSQILTRQIGGFIPAVNVCPGPSGGAFPAPFFLGAADHLRMATSFSIEQGARGYPQIVDYRVIPAPGAGGGVRLVVNEYPYTGPASLAPFCADSAPVPNAGASAPPTGIPPANAIVIADHLQSCRFFYRLQRPGNYEPLDWVPLWLEQQSPAVIRIEMTPIADLTSGQQPIPMLGVTVPIRTDREPLATYVDRIQ
jgi:prepilin-type N-terminal cleavage/methylation domain-containing protein